MGASSKHEGQRNRKSSKKLFENLTGGYGWVSQNWDLFTLSRQGELGGILGTVCFMVLKNR